MPNDKQHVGIVVIGHVDSGKSTTSGHLIYDRGKIDKETIAECEKKALSSGDSSRFSWVLDKLRAERERSPIIDNSLWRFDTEKTGVSVIDVPGHRDFIKNMITGTTRADAALLVVAANSEFEAGLSVGGQTREHALLAYTMGVKQMIVAVNKMDLTKPSWSEERFLTITQVIGECLEATGYKPSEIPFIPISGYNDGDNITRPSTSMAWWKGFDVIKKERFFTEPPKKFSGLTLLDAFDTVIPPKRPDFQPLRMPLKDIYKINGVGTVAIGRVETGTLDKAMKVVIGPQGVAVKVKSIEMNQLPLQQAFPGDVVSFNTKELGSKDIATGSVVGDYVNEPPVGVESFDAQIIVLNHLDPITVGYSPMFDCHTVQIMCIFKQLKAKVDRRNNKVIEVNPKSLLLGDSAIVTLEPSSPICIETYHDYPTLGRFAIRDKRQTVAVGVVTSIIKKKPPPPATKRTMSLRLIKGGKLDKH